MVRVVAASRMYNRCCAPQTACLSRFLQPEATTHSFPGAQSFRLLLVLVTLRILIIFIIIYVVSLLFWISSHCAQ
jgi:hypothetical protein